MLNKAFTSHGNAHGAKDRNPIIAALDKVTTHSNPHLFDDYYPLETTWKPIPICDCSLKFGRVSDGPKIRGYLAARQANRPYQSSMPKIKYVPAHQQARAEASSCAKPVCCFRRRSNKSTRSVKVFKVSSRPLDQKISSL